MPTISVYSPIKTYSPVCIHNISVYSSITSQCIFTNQNIFPSVYSIIHQISVEGHHEVRGGGRVHVFSQFI